MGMLGTSGTPSNVLASASGAQGQSWRVRRFFDTDPVSGIRYHAALMRIVLTVALSVAVTAAW